MQYLLPRAAYVYGLFLIPLLVVAGCGSDNSAGPMDGGAAGIGGGDAGTAGTGGDGGAGGISGRGGDGGAGGGGTGGSAGGAGTGGVGGTSPADPTSLDLIDAALAAAEITDIDALRFKVFAMFADERLPEQFRIDERFEGTEVMTELNQRWDTLPMVVQDELQPFLLPPVAPGSWYELRQAAANGSLTPKGGELFSEVEAVGGDVAIRWPANLPGLALQAGTVKTAMEGSNGVWQTLTSLMGREPLSDLLIFQDYNGGDGRFDIYIVQNANVTSQHLQGCYGWASPYSSTFFSNPTGNDTSPAYLVLNADVNTKIVDLRDTLAHEFMHVLGFAFDVARTNFRSWLSESTATWAGHYVFPLGNGEHIYPDDYLDVPHLTLTNLSGVHEYGAYLYWLFLTDRPGGDPNIIRSVWEQTESMNNIEAVNAASPGGFIETFPDFAVMNWNRAPFRDTAPYDVYKKDMIMQVVAVETEQPKVTSSQVDVAVSFKGGGVSRLSAQYVHYKFTDSATRSLLFANGYTFDLAKGVPPTLQGAFGDQTFYAEQVPSEAREGRKVLALVKQNGNWKPDPLDLTNVAFAPFCQEAMSESLEELVLIFVNAEHRENKPFHAVPPGLAPRLFATNIGCGAWSGTAHVQDFSESEDGFERSDTEVKVIEFKRNTLTLEQIAAGQGQLPFGQEIIPRGVLPDVFFMFDDSYDLTNLSAEWSYSEERGRGTSNVCMGSGSGKLTHNDAQSTLFQVAPYLTASSGGSDPSLYRSFFVQVVLITPDEPVSGECSSTGPYTKFFATGLAGGYNNLEELGKLTIDASGNRILECWTLGDLVFDLDLTSRMLP
jgi:hypothetical protein